MITIAIVTAVCVLVAVIVIMSYLLGKYHGEESSQDRIEELEEQLDQIAEDKLKAERASQFRIRTAESDPNRQARVAVARLRAKRTITPDPRR